MIGVLIGADEQSLPSSPTASLCSPGFLQGTDFSALAADLEDALTTQIAREGFGIGIWILHDCFDTVLSKVSFRWEDILEDPLSDALLIPESLYKILDAVYVGNYSHDRLSSYVRWAYDYIIFSMSSSTPPIAGPKPRPQSLASIYFVLASVLRVRPHSFVLQLRRLEGMQRRHKEKRDLDTTPLTVWMIAQASHYNSNAALFSWARLLLPLLPQDQIMPRSRDLIWLLVEKYLAKPELRKKFPIGTFSVVPMWVLQPLIPAPSLEILLGLRFTTQEGTTTRFVRNYTSLKKKALNTAINGDSAVRQIFTPSLRLVGQGNRLLADEAASIAIWSLKTDVLCWEDWYNIYEKNAGDSAALIKTIVEKPESHSLVLSSSSKQKQRFIQEMFTFSLKLAGKGSPLVAKEAAGIALWSLTQNVVCWKRWEYICQENVEASVALLKTLVEKCKDNSIKPSSSSSSSSSSKRKAIQEIFNVSLRLAGKAKEAAEIAMWSLTQDVVCWKRWNYIYTYEEMNKEKTKEKITEKIKQKFNRHPMITMVIKEKIKEKNKEKNIKEENTTEENIEASVALLKTLVERRNYHSLKQVLLSPTDTLTLAQTMRNNLTLTQTMESFRLKNKQAITEGGANGRLYKVADKSCKVILGRVSPRSSSLIAMVLATTIAIAIAAAAFLMNRGNLCFHNHKYWI